MLTPGKALSSPSQGIPSHLQAPQSRQSPMCSCSSPSWSCPEYFRRKPFRGLSKQTHRPPPTWNKWLQGRPISVQSLIFFCYASDTMDWATWIQNEIELLDGLQWYFGQTFMAHGGQDLNAVIPCLFVKHHLWFWMKYLAIKLGAHIHIPLRMNCNN